MKPTCDIVITTSKGDNFKVKGVTHKGIKSSGTLIVIESVDELQMTFDHVARDRDINIENVEVVDVGF